MSDLQEQTSYFLTRANQEAACAKQANDSRAAAAHRELAMRYSVMAFQLQAAELDG